MLDSIDHRWIERLISANEHESSRNLERQAGELTQQPFYTHCIEDWHRPQAEKCTRKIVFSMSIHIIYTVGGSSPTNRSLKFSAAGWHLPGLLKCVHYQPILAE